MGGMDAILEWECDILPGRVLIQIFIKNRVRSSQKVPT
jgi:hypothetical protein